MHETREATLCVDRFEEVTARSPLWSRWAELRASAAASQCPCVPAGPPGAEECSRAARQRAELLIHVMLSDSVLCVT